MKIRGIIHFHTSHSYDSLSRPRTLIESAMKRKLDFLVPTDHDTLAGARELKSIATKIAPEIEVALAAEYKTSEGDVIAAFLKEEIVARTFDSFVAEVKNQAGLILLPHPYSQHTNVDKIAAVADLIEVFNSRCSKEQNLKAELLAKSLGKPAYGSPDAHIASTLLDVVISLERKDTLKESLLNSNILIESQIYTKKSDIILSQVVKKFRRRRWLEGLENCARYGKALVQEARS